MGKKLELRTHKASVDRAHAGLSPENLRQGKCAAKRNAGLTRKAYNIANASAKRERDPRKQLAKLDFRLGVGVGAKRERARLQKLINKE